MDWQAGDESCNIVSTMLRGGGGVKWVNVAYA